MKRSYRTRPRLAKLDRAQFQEDLENALWLRASELLQAVLEAEVDETLERLRYERRSDGARPGYRDGHDRPRTIASTRGPITIERPRVRGVRFASAILPKHRRKLENLDQSMIDLWLDGLATRDFEWSSRGLTGSTWVLAPMTSAASS